MRILLLLLLFAAPAFAEQRTWTIFTDTYTTNAELVEVRGETVYLRVNGKIESVPMSRLSPDDQHYISLLQTANVFPGPADNDRVQLDEALPMPVPHSDAKPLQPLTNEQSLLIAPPTPSAPILAPANGIANGQMSAPAIAQSAPSGLPPGTLFRLNQNGQLVPIAAPVAVAPKNYASQASVNMPDNPNARRTTQQQPPPQQQPQKQAKSNSDARRSDQSRDDSRRGLLGRRREDRARN